MFRSLWFRLIGALIAVTGIVLIVVIGVSRWVVSRQFDVYSIRSGEVWAAQVAPILAEQYETDGDWSHAQELLINPWRATRSAPPSGGMGPMMGQDGHPGGPAGPNMWRAMGIHMVVIDSQGVVVADSHNILRGEQLAVEFAERGTPVMVNEVSVGRLVAIPSDANNRAEIGLSFLSTVSQSTSLAALAAGVAAVVVGTWLFWLITKPLSQMQKAALAIEAGDLATRVPITTRDELGALGEAFNQMASRLEKQQALRKQMVADVAHDLRTPLSVMQATIEAMQDGVLKPNKQELQNLHHEVRQLTRLVEDLRTLSLADEGQLRLELRAVNIGAMVEQIGRARSSVAEARRIRLEIMADPSMASIRADEDRLVEALHNVLENALRHTPEGGVVRVEAAQSAAETAIRVIDTGAGISTEDLPYVFERFWRSDKARSRESGGSGIGLAIARQLIELHGGTINVESEVGKGSVFTIRLPKSTA